MLALSACAPVSDSDVETSVPAQKDISAADPDAATPSPAVKAANQDVNQTSKELAESPVGMRDCATTNYVSKPLAKGENEAVFDQFNFRPNAVTVYADTVAVETADYTFYYCQQDKNWVPISNETELKSPEERWYDLNVADPDYRSIEANGEVYEYRVRLKADWVNERERGDRAEADADGEEDTVYFDLKLPDGTEISRELYTVSDLQAAKLGASLGVPDVAGAAVKGGYLWFAATASQGEGDSGFASILKYDLESEALSVEQPKGIQGEQINDMVATAKDGAVTLWLGTQRMGEGVPFYPTSGLVAYQPESGELKAHTITNSPLVGAIPYALAVEGKDLWVATGDGPCRVKWQRLEKAKSWDCWRLAATAQLPKEGVDLYRSFLTTETDTQITNSEVEVLWAAQSYDDSQTELDESELTRYEVVYEPGFETTLSQGGYRVADGAARRAAGGESIFWPGRQWHWAGDRFRRGLDEVGLNLVGGGPYGLVSSQPTSGLRFDHNAIRGAFDLLELTPEGTKVRYYSGWVDADAIEVYPRLKTVVRPKKMKPNPLTEMASDLPNSGP